MGRFIDDDWRQVLEANGFTPAGVREEVWRSPYSDLKVKIDVNPLTEEPYYQVITEDGTRLAKDSDTEALKTILKPQEAEPPQLSPEEAEKKDNELLNSMGIKAGSIRTEEKIAAGPPRFSFAVPTSVAAVVAFHLTKAGMRDFEVTHFKEDEVSGFTFNSEPEMHIGEEIVKQEFADQIKHGKGMWKHWMPKPDVTEVKGERELSKPKQYVSSVLLRGNKIAGQWGERSYDSDQVHDILDRYRPKGNQGRGFDEPVPDEEVPALLEEINSELPSEDDNQLYLGVVLFLVTHDSPVPASYRERARQIAFQLVQNEEYIASWKTPELRKAELEKEIELLEGSERLASRRKAKASLLATIRREDDEFSRS